jgi:hypothetical protein
MICPGFRDCSSGFGDVSRRNCGARRSKTDIQNPQHNYTKALIASRPSSLDFRLKRLPTIQNFLDDTIMLKCSNPRR